MTAIGNLLNSIIDVIFPELTQTLPCVTTKTVLHILSNYLRPADFASVPYDQLKTELKKVSRGKVPDDKIKSLYEAANHSIGVTEGINQLELVLKIHLSRIQELISYKHKIGQAITTIAQRLPETKYMLSLKGIGVITVAVTRGETGGLVSYRNAWEIIKLAGLNLYCVSSGKFKGKTKITKRGWSILRWILYFAALRQSRIGMPLHEFYRGFSHNGGCKTKALIAVVRKLIRLLFALVRVRRAYTQTIL